METVNPTRIEVDIAKLALDAADIPSIVIGIGAAMEGGIAGVKLQVPEDRDSLCWRGCSGGRVSSVGRVPSLQPPLRRA